LVSQAVEKFGRLDVVILNAAVSHTRLFEDTRPEDNFFHIQVNYMQVRA
jgi:NAD(P)-dependent dehydrogenase (short-subunit alcohol dehydrogenase family)